MIEDDIGVAEVEVREGVVISRGTQVPHDDGVQITASKDELMQRIESFMKYKRRQIDVSNRLEFIHTTTPDEYSCARVDAVMSRTTPTHHITAHKILNKEGPNAHYPTPREQLWAELIVEQAPPIERPNVSHERLVNLEKRCEILEETLEYRAASSSLLDRVKAIEVKLLELEGKSVEYSY